MRASLRAFIVLLGLALAVPASAQSAGRPLTVSGPAVGLLLPKPKVAPRHLASKRPAELAMISHRAKVLGDRASAAGTRYFTVRDADLFGLSREEVLNRLNVHEVAVGVRTVELVVDLSRPLVLHVGRNEQALIGTTIVSAQRLRNLEVRSTIFASEVVVRRSP